MKGKWVKDDEEEDKLMMNVVQIFIKTRKMKQIDDENEFFCETNPFY